MKLPLSLTAAVLAGALLAGCGTPDDAGNPPEPTATTSPTEDATDDGAAGGSQLAAVALRFDGEPVPIASACTGADGAVMATTEGEVTITLVQEDGTALRYDGEGMTAETSEVETEQVGESTIYSATLESDQVPAVDVEFEVNDTSSLEECQA